MKQINKVDKQRHNIRMLIHNSSGKWKGYPKQLEDTD